MDLSILAWAVIGLVIVGAPIAAALGVTSFFDQLLAKPKKPKAPETPEQIVARMKSVAKMVAMTLEADKKAAH
jgi:hypothetical protein